MAIKLYQYNNGEIREIEAERETECFWIINGRRESKILTDYPSQVWHRTPEEAIKAVITHASRKRDSYLESANYYQGRIDEAASYLSKLQGG